MSKNATKQIKNKYNEIKTKVLTKVNQYLTKERKDKFTTWFENGGKTTIFFGVLIILLIILASQFISFKKPQTTNHNSAAQNTTKNESIPLNQAEYAGYKIDISDTDFKITVLEHTENIKKVEVSNESVKMTINSTKLLEKPQAIQTGFTPENGQIMVNSDQILLYELKGRKLGLKPQILNNVTSYTLVSISKNLDGKDIYNSKFNLFGEQNKEYGYFDEVVINNLHKDITQRDTESLEKAISILQNSESVTAKEIFVDTVTAEDVKKLQDTKKYSESNKLKYKLSIIDGYSLKDSNDINLFSLQKDDTSKVEITKKDAQIPDTAKNLKQIGSSSMYRSSSLSSINNRNLIIQIYSNKGDYKTINLYPNNTQNIVLVNYTISLNQSVDDIKTKIKELDTILSTISDNSSKEMAKCEKLRGQEMPFGSPLCGKQLDYTKINRGYSVDHKAIDIVPNEEYAKQNETYKKTNKEVFYSPCDGTETVSQDKVTKANIITIKCKNDAFIIQFWHDSESFWSYDNQIKAGDAIGVMGDTGSAAGKHIHYVIEKNGERLDPLELIKS
ncbi:MAG: M23 family metallopeptidase [candidate division SR1 bacterium]|nr:M23 family metallopeptidase [candidate division SR1 bacterium]